MPNRVVRTAFDWGMMADMDYDLDRLGPTEFEHMVQSLAIAELGVSVTTFGAGKDAGREATFRGKVYSAQDDELELWDGYGVVQAKTIRFAHDPAENARTLVASITAELDRFVPKSGADHAEREPKPDYYIVATNARLSPAGDVGGVDVLAKLLDDHKVKLHGHSIWHYEHICRLLDRHPQIRKTYAGFITSGDILSRLAEMLDGGSAQIGELLKTHAASQIAARQALKLETSDLGETDKVALSDIAVDLPAIGDNYEQHMAIAHILAAGDHSLRNSVRGKHPYGFVIIGGPGQGKSTIGQIICQAYRVGLFEGWGGSITPKIDRAIADTKALLADISLSVPRNRRWPVFIDLSVFADAMAENPALTVTEFVAKQLRSQGSKISANQVASWLRDWPWTLVLDGLDEVPARQSRNAIIGALNDLIVESRLNDWDVLIVCTTRPQGYDGEFSELDPEQLELTYLGPAEGLKYARRIIRAKFENDPEKASRVLERVTQASNQELSARLMSTPLQITIMEYLLEELSEVPGTRHELFDGYYRAIYLRESGKAGHLGQMLKRYSEQVEWVHEQTALYLQVQAEKTGDSYASVGDGAIVDLFRRRLLDQQYDDSDVERIAAELDKATKQRLVLLVPRTEGQLSFEVRSLQEYMAARAIVSGDADTVFERLTALAPSSYWRNTWLLAAGRMYGDRPHERDGLIEKLKQLDTNSTIGSFIGYGARLAINLLEDDFALAVPAHRKSLLSLAMTQISRWAGPELKRLSAICRSFLNGTDQQAAALVIDVVSAAFQSGGRARVGAVAVLRDFEKDPGKSGSIARKLLQSDSSWRPANNHARASARPQSNAGKVFTTVAKRMDLTEEERSIWTTASGPLTALSVPVDVTPAEAVTISRIDLTIQPSDELVRIMSDPTTQQLLIRIANEVPIADASAPIGVRRTMVAIDQSRRFGPFIEASSLGVGLFDA